MRNSRPRTKRTNESQDGLFKRTHRTLRKLVLKSGIWGWRVTRGYWVIIHGPDGKKYKTDGCRICGQYYDLERAQRKGCRDAAVMPSDVRGYIEREILHEV